MAKEYKYASIICAGITCLAAAGIVVGIWNSKPLVTAVGIIPAILYEIYRTEGVFTRLASWMLLIVILAAIYGMYNNIMIDIVPYISKFIAFPVSSKLIPAALLAPVMLVVLAVFLFRRTAGIYTRWLAIVILITSIALFYCIDPGFIKNVISSPELKHGIKEGAKRGMGNIY